MNKEEDKKPIIILSKDKVVINGIEITDYESWEKVVKSLADFKRENKQLKEEIQDLKADYGNKAQVERDLLAERINKAITYIKSEYESLCDDTELLEILGENSNDK